jgi:hypothetical protein
VIEQAALNVERRFEIKIVEEFLHQAMDCIARQADSVGADLLVVPNDQYLLAQVEEWQRFYTAL